MLKVFSVGFGMDFLLFKIGEIPPGGLSIEIPGRGVFDGWRNDVSRLEMHTVIDGTGWQGDLLSVIQEMELSFPLGFEGTISVERTEATLIVRGHLMTVVRRACGRCTELFDRDLDISFKSVFTHDQVTGKDIELKREDLEFNIFHGDMFDVGQVIIEQISLNLPIKPLCQDDCLGLCVRCGRNLNEGICGCKDESVDIRFEKLKNLHLK
jgi:uncharacterized protein